MEFDTKQMRDALGQFVTGVTVATVLPSRSSWEAVCNTSIQLILLLPLFWQTAVS